MKNKKNVIKIIIFVVGLILIVVGVIFIFLFSSDEKTIPFVNNSSDLVCNFEGKIGEGITINNEISFEINDNNVVKSKAVSIMKTSNVSDEIFVELKNYNMQMIENGTSIKNFYTVNSDSNDSFTVNEVIDYTDNSKNSLDINQMRANLLLPTLSEDYNVDVVKKSYIDYGYECK